MNQRLKDYLSQNILVSDEVCTTLNISRQRLNVLVTDNRIVPFKDKNGHKLFWLADVLAYRDNKGRKKVIKDRYVYFDLYTSRARKLVKSLFEDGDFDKEDISEILIYRYALDAIFDGRYEIRGDSVPDTLCSIAGPTFVIILKDGREIWTDGLNCGYGGEGPNGSLDVLSFLALCEDATTRNIIVSNRSVRLLRHNGKWITLPGNFEFGVDELECSDLTLYSYNNELVLAENRREYRYNKFRSFVFLKLCSLMIKSPIYIRVSSDKTGDALSIDGGLTEYQSVVTDRNGSELWLYNPFRLSESIIDRIKRKLTKEIPIICLRDFFKALDFDIDEELEDKGLEKWLSTEVRIVEL